MKRESIQKTGGRADGEGKELITVAVTCYNIEKYVEKAMLCVLHQTYPRLEIIAVDDGSTDRTGQILDEIAGKYPERDIRIFHTQNQGPGRARNLAIEEARGAYLGFVDGDDTIEPQMFEWMYTALIHTASDLCICGYKECHVEEQAQPVPERESVSTHVYDRADIYTLSEEELLTLYIEENEQVKIRNAVWNKLYKRELIASLRMPAQMQYEDILFTMKLIGQTKGACYIDLPLYHYVVDRKDSIMNRGASRGILTDQIPAYRKKDAYLKSIGREDLVCVHDYLVYKKLLLLYTEARRSKDPEKRACLKELRQAILPVRRRMKEIYSCSIANPHEKLRMQLFLLHPVFYNLFMDVNEGLILPMRQGRDPQGVHKP